MLGFERIATPSHFAANMLSASVGAGAIASIAMRAKTSAATRARIGSPARRCPAAGTGRAGARGAGRTLSRNLPGEAASVADGGRSIYGPMGPVVTGPMGLGAVWSIRRRRVPIGVADSGPTGASGGRRRYNPLVSRFYSLDAANALVPDLAVVTERLREQREELVGLRDAYRDREGVVLGDVIAAAERPRCRADADDTDADPELRRLRLRMRGLVDQMQADVAWLDERDIVLRDIATGLVDFPALASGRQVWLCWHLGEQAVGWWHGVDEGFAGRRPLQALPDQPARA